MTTLTSRRRFLAGVGQGMLVASVGPSLARDLGLAPLLDGHPGDELDFGELEPLVAFMQETDLAKLIPGLCAKLRAGTDLRTLVSAGALANARTFGGEDYTGYHCAMALVPAFEMGDRLPARDRPLPVLKVLYRNTHRIAECGGRRREVLRRLDEVAEPPERPGPKLLECVRGRDIAGAEKIFAGLVRRDPAGAYEDLQLCVQDDVNVHRVVLAWRAWDMLRLTGEKHAHTLLRQSVRFCVDEETQIRRRGPSSIRRLLPELLEKHALLDREPGQRRGDDAWLRSMSRMVFGSSRDDAARAVAEALAEGFAPEDLGEAISVAANRLVLSDPGRRDSRDPTKPKGSVHGASVGVHAQDAANAWREIARVADHRNRAASLIVGAYHTAGQSGHVEREPLALPENLPGLAVEDGVELLAGARRCILEGDQLGASAFVKRYGELGHPPRPAFDLLLEFAVIQDGALHAEKYYRTIEREFDTTRPAFRWDHLVALGRVTASQHGWRAPGVEEAKELLEKQG